MKEMKGIKKMATKRQVLEALNTFTFDEVLVGETVVTPEDIKDFIEKSIIQLDAKNEKAAERAAAKRAAGDELRAQVKAVLGTTPLKVSEIVTLIDNPEVTNAKVIARLTQLVKAGEVVKDDVKEDGRTLKVYSLAE